jgi:hypothetical protein
MYLKALPETTIQRAQDKPEFLAYHPLTPIPSLPLLLPRSLVCIAGRVIEKSGVQRVDISDGEKSVPVAYLILRCHGDVVRINFWRETTSLLDTLATGGLIYLQGVAKQWPRGDVDSAQYVELRAVPRTKVVSCTPALEGTLADTPLDAAGAKDWSPRPITEKKDYSEEPATWMSLSIVDSVVASGHIRDLHQVFQVPSIFLEIGSSLTYYGCSKCGKGWREEASPSCNCGASRVELYRVKLGLRDSTGQLRATCFDTFENVVNVYKEAIGSTCDLAPKDFSTDEMASKLATHIAAVPFTARITVAADGWQEGMQATVHLLKPTFTTQGVLHPLTSVVRMGQGSGGCPPFPLADTTFDPGLGMTQAQGNVVECFRGLVAFMDDPVDNIADSRVQRVVRCVCAPDECTVSYNVELQGEEELLQRLGAFPKESVAHTILTWRTSELLSMISFMPVSTADCEFFRPFFQAEIRSYASDATSGRWLRTAMNGTPLRILDAASQANQTSPPSWKSRKIIVRNFE